MESPSKAQTTAKPGFGRWRLYGSGAVAVLLAGLAVLYATGGFVSNGDPECRGSLATARSLDRFRTGEVAAMGAPARPVSMKRLAFTDADGRPVSIGDFAGKTVLLNFWATWCGPCRAEMPALAKLQAERGGADFQVVALNTADLGLERAKAFLQEVGAGGLAFYVDATNAMLRSGQLSGQGLPQTYLIDREGCQIGFAAGPAEWASPDALALVDAAVKAGR